MNRLITVIACLLVTLSAFSQKDPIERVWFNEEKSSKIQIFKGTDGKYHGKIVWLQKQHDDNGKPRTDIHNSNESQRNQPLMNLVILKGYSKNGSDNAVFEGGTVYDPNNGKTYCGKLTFKNDKILLRGFICGFTFLGRSSTWTLAE